MQIQISSQIREASQQLRLATITCKVNNSMTSDEFWTEMELEIERIKSTYSIDAINKRIEIAATRKIYKTLGKDPNRYRPSAEALCRRIVRDIPIYRVSMLVDIINLVSIRSAFSIGGFDHDKIQGNIVLGVGSKGDEFEAIGRGLLNVEGLPLFRDAIGGIGTPTSDNERTKISTSTTNLLLIINGYSGVNGLQETVNHAIELMQRYANMKEYSVEWIE
jgi:DNA/RNA-binding domain of Phe-tRNA-synthetase-like protein